MAVPKKKTSKSRRGMRRSHHAISPINLVVDPVTGDYKLPHHINPITGTYKIKAVKDAKGKHTHEAVKFINIKQKFDEV